MTATMPSTVRAMRAEYRFWQREYLEHARSCRPFAEGRQCSTAVELDARADDARKKWDWAEEQARRAR